MRTKAVLILFLLFFFLSGCGNPTAPDKVELLKIDGMILENATVIQTYTEAAQINTIMRAIETAKKINGILDVVSPEYCLKLYYPANRTTTYFLWLGQDNNYYHGMIMNNEDTHTGYKLTEEAVRSLLEVMPQAAS